MPRNLLSQDQKYQGFAKAVSTFTRHRELGNFLSAYVVAFSIFEDRVTACLMLAKDAAGQPRPSKPLRHYEKVKYLENQNHIDHDRAEDWRSAGDERNALLHAAMWNVDAVTDEHCAGALQRARSADQVSRRIKKAVAQKNKSANSSTNGEP